MGGRVERLPQVKTFAHSLFYFMVQPPPFLFLMCSSAGSWNWNSWANNVYLHAATTLLASLCGFFPVLAITAGRDKGLLPNPKRQGRWRGCWDAF